MSTAVQDAVGENVIGTLLLVAAASVGPEQAPIKWVKSSGFAPRRRATLGWNGSSRSRHALFCRPVCSCIPTSPAAPAPNAELQPGALGRARSAVPPISRTHNVYAQDNY